METLAPIFGPWPRDSRGGGSSRIESDGAGIQPLGRHSCRACVAEGSSISHHRVLCVRTLGHHAAGLGGWAEWEGDWTLCWQERHRGGGIALTGWRFSARDPLCCCVSPVKRLFQSSAQIELIASTDLTLMIYGYGVRKARLVQTTNMVEKYEIGGSVPCRRLPTSSRPRASPPRSAWQPPLEAAEPLCFPGFPPVSAFVRVMPVGVHRKQTTRLIWAVKSLCTKEKFKAKRIQGKG